jgi:hypothetical protein
MSQMYFGFVFYLNRSRNVEMVGLNSLTPVSKVWFVLDGFS